MTVTLNLGPKLELPLDIVTEATAIVATRGAGKSSASAVIVEEAFAADVQTITFDRTGVYWGLRSNSKGDGPGLAIYVLGGPHGDVPLEPTAGKLLADLAVDSSHSFVLDLSDLSKGQAVRFAADFLERLYDRKARSRTTTLLVMDEAHFYAPQTPRGGFKGDAAKLMGAMEDVVGLGRSRGLGVVLTTQRTQALNKAVLDLIETLLVMRMLSPRARDAVKGWIQEKHEDDEHGVLASLDSLPTGTAWVWAPLRGILTKVALRRIRTFDSYRTPKPGEQLVEPSKRKELDLTALGEQMRATVERAKQDDPAELRKTITQLQRQVAELEQRPVDVPAPVVEQVEVAVPFVPPEARQTLDKLRDALVDVKGFADELVIDFNEAETSLPPSAPRPTPARPTPAPTAAASAGTERARPATSRAAAQEDLTGPQQRVLDSLAWLEAVGFPEPSKIQIGFIAGYRVGKRIGGTYGNVLGQLHTSGLISYPTQGVATLTEAGRDLATLPNIERTTRGLQQAVFDRLAGAERRVLEGIIAAYPEPLTKQEAGELAGYTVGDRIGGTFGNILGRLRSLGLIDYPSPGLVAAEPVLFLEAR